MARDDNHGFDDDFDDDFDDEFVEFNEAAPEPASGEDSPPAPPSSSYDSDDDPEEFDLSDSSDVLSDRVQPTVPRARRLRRRSEPDDADASPAATELEPEPEVLSEPEEPEGDGTPRKGRGCLAGVAIAVITFVVAAIAVWLLVGRTLVGGGDETASEPTSSPKLSSSAVAPSPATSQNAVDSKAAVKEAMAAECKPSDKDPVRGSGPGSQDSGSDVIFAFDHAYYVGRSGEKARSYLADHLTKTTAETMQEAIDELPEGTGHCLEMTPKEGEEDVWSVTLTEFIPDGDEVTKNSFKQEIWVAENDGKWEITSLVAD